MWRVEIKNTSHDHEPLNDTSGHPYDRRFSQEETARIKEMTAVGIFPRQILTSLQKNNPNLKAVSKTLYNTKAKLLKESLQRRSMIQALLDELGQSGFTYDLEYGQDSRLTHLIFAHPSSTTLTKSYSNIFIMDCTYKTNKYKMLLLDIIGVSSFNTSFYSCFVFMQQEGEKDYIWALTKFSKMLGDGLHPSVIVSDRERALMNVISVVFSNTTNLLCVWHMQKNLVANCKHHFKENDDWVTFIGDWKNLIMSHSESSFDEAWCLFQVQYQAYEHVLGYIRRIWLPFKEYFVDAWTEQNLHFGNRVTSRAEGAHAMLKKYLQVSTGDFRTVKEKISNAINNQFQEIKAALSTEKIRIPHHFGIPLFKNLVSCVSVFALEKLYKQYELALSNSLPIVCKGRFSKTMGLPCVHKMRMMNNEMLQLNDIHPQWRIDVISSFHTDGNMVDQENHISDLLQGLKNKYEKLPLAQKDNIRMQISQF